MFFVSEIVALPDVAEYSASPAVAVSLLAPQNLSRLVETTAEDSVFGHRALRKRYSSLFNPYPNTTGRNRTVERHFKKVLQKSKYY